MADFTSVALAIALGVGNIAQVAPPIGDVRYGRLLYEVRSVNDGRGVGGVPPNCVRPDQDLVMIVYTVRNQNDFSVAAQAIPRIVMLTPDGATHPADRSLTDTLAAKLTPYLRVRGGRLDAGGVVVLADVFVTKKNAVRDFPWMFRVQPQITTPVKLPIARRADPLACPPTIAVP